MLPISTDHFSQTETCVGWWVSLNVRGEETFDDDEGVFLVTLGDDGRCTEFREW